LAAGVQKSSGMTSKHGFAITCAVIALSSAGEAWAWRVGTPLDFRGCHEPITAEALRAVRANLATAPRVTPTADEAALIADVQFEPPGDLAGDLAAMSLLLAVRDNDLKGADPLSSLDVVEVHGDPTTQDEHCIRARADDGDAGQLAALAACRAFIHARAAEALAGLDAAGTVDAGRRMPLQVFVSIAGQVSPQLPVFYVKIGQAVHALQDGFTHVYRTADGMRVTAVLNWLDFAAGELDEPRDGPPHRLPLDNCALDDALIQRNVALTTQATTELLRAALDPARTPDEKLAAIDAVTARYLAFEPGCTADNDWCAAPEDEVTDSVVGCGCRATGGGGAAGLALGALVPILVLRRRRRRASITAGATLALALVAAGAVVAPGTARAEDPPAPVPAPAPEAADDPAVVAPPTEPEDVDDVVEGKEPGRDVKTPTVEEVQAVRKDKKLGSKLGFALNVGGAIARPAAAGAIGVRYRIDERWIIGLDAAWNPWITTSPVKMTAGAFEVYATGIRRFPMRFDRVNLRTSLHVGTSTLLFDVYGAPKRSTGLYLAGCLLGLDYDLGKSLRLVIDPAEMAIAIPHLGDLPLWYEQFRFMIGLQYGA
jgi:MYXO-CTERM domain-containing protein